MGLTSMNSLLIQAMFPEPPRLHLQKFSEPSSLVLLKITTHTLSDMILLRYIPWSIPHIISLTNVQTPYPNICNLKVGFYHYPPQGNPK